MDITFKYVGSGDSIILEWQEEDMLYGGVIDCNRYKGINPSKRHIRNEGIDALRFLIFSHPHSDHYSGVLDLLKFCRREDIIIDIFGHTNHVGPEYIRSLKDSRGNKERLTDIHLLAREMENEGIIGRRAHIRGEQSTIKIGQSARVVFLAPTTDEYDKFTEAIFDTDLKVGRDADPNILATLCKIEFDNRYILLTSDVKRSVLDKETRDKLRKEDRTMFLCQVPHHGSLSNHSKEFWKRRYKKGHKHYAAVSVGPNPDGHPSDEVISDLRDFGYFVQSTWNQPISDRARKAKRMLACSSTAVNSAYKSGTDLHYSLTQ